jgi:hypothetical protein
MSFTRSVHQVLYFTPLLLGASAILLEPGRSVAPGAVFVILAIYAHAAARVVGAVGTDKAVLFLEGLPFFALGVASLGQQGVVPALLIVVSGAVAGAAILAGEWLLISGSPTFTTSLGFIGACCLAGWGLIALPPVRFLGLALVALTLSGYGVVRRASG